MIRFNAKYYAIIEKCFSTEDTRYYLHGVFVEPHDSGKGVTLTATDGSILLSMYDENGTADEKQIVQLTPEAAKTCVNKHKHLPREIVAQDGTAKVMEPGEPSRTVAIAEKCFIDGTYPDWRRIVPEMPTVAAFSGYQARYMALLAKIAVELKERKEACFTIKATSETGPAIVQFSGVEHAFAVLMPVGGNYPSAFPAWFRTPPEIVTAAA